MDTKQNRTSRRLRFAASVAIAIVASGVVHAAVSLSPPVVAIYAPTPEYPEKALERHAQGKGIFVLRVQVSSGRVKKVYVARSTGHADLDKTAEKTLQRWRFEPNRLPSIKQLFPKSNDPFAEEDSLTKVPVSFEVKRSDRSTGL